MSASTYRTELSKSVSSHIRVSRGTGITSVRGEVWLTIDGRPDDIILEPGQTYLFERRATVFIAAFAPATAEWKIDAKSPLRAIVGAIECVLSRLARTMHASNARPVRTPF